MKLKHIKINKEPSKDAPDMVDHELESREYRKKFGPIQGELCISILPGNELGELYLNVQFEGRPGAHDFCQEGQNHVLEKSFEWLKELFADSHVDWDLIVDPHPCPETKIEVNIEHLLGIPTKHPVDIQRPIQRDLSIENKIGSGGDSNVNDKP